MAQQFEQRVFVPLLAGDFGNDLLRQNVEWLLRHDQRVEFTARTQSSRAAHSTRSSREIGNSRAFGVPPTCARPPDALQERGD